MIPRTKQKFAKDFKSFKTSKNQDRTLECSNIRSYFFISINSVSAIDSGYIMVS